MTTLSSSARQIGRLGRSPVRLIIGGVAAALLIAALAMWWLMRPGVEELATLVGTLAFTAVFSLALGFVLYHKGWTRSPSLILTLVLTYAWAAALTLVNVWVLARLMFASAHDLTLAGILLVFAAIIATTFGFFVAASVTRSLRLLVHAAGELAEGDLTARVPVLGQDEAAQVAMAFNAMADQLEAAAQQKHEVELMRRDLIAWVSHDLRTPLTGIRVMVEALHDGLVSDEETRQRYYRAIRADVMGLNQLIDDLFELAQLDAGGIALDKELSSLADLVSDTLESFRPLAEKRQITLQGEVSASVDPVRMSAAKIGRVLNNLVANALNHTPVNGQVTITAQRTKEGVQVTVRDSGPGFNRADLPRIFERFYRGGAARSRDKGGAGLGLAIAAGFVEAHNGRIAAENRPEGGAQVSFILP